MASRSSMAIHGRAMRRRDFVGLFLRPLPTTPMAREAGSGAPNGLKRGYRGHTISWRGLDSADSNPPTFFDMHIRDRRLRYSRGFQYPLGFSDKTTLSITTLIQKFPDRLIGRRCRGRSSGAGPARLHIGCPDRCDAAAGSACLWIAKANRSKLADSGF